MATFLQDITELDKNDAKNYKRVYEESGFSGLRTAIIGDISKWKNVTTRIAITGNTGSGKSSLVYSLRGLSADSDMSAPVGVTETTTKIKEYKHPKNPNIVFSDLPGIGSVNFPTDHYLQTMKFDTFDVFIIVAAKRFTENDSFLAKEITSRNKKIFFVRTQIDNDIRNDERCGNNRPSSKDILKLIREDCQNNLKGVADKSDIFLIDNYNRDKYDFAKLELRLIHDTEGLLREAMVMTIFRHDKDFIDEKHSLLKSRIWKIALLAAFAPRVGNIDIKILQDEKETYKEQFS